MKKTTILLGAAILLLGAAVSFPGRPATVATVDITKVFDGLDEQRYLEQRVKQVADKMAADKDRMSRELQDLSAELESYKPGTPPYNEALRKVEEAVGALGAQDQFGQLKIEAERASALRDLYAHVRDAAVALAKEQKIDYILVNDSIPPIEPANVQGTRQQLALRRFLVADGSMDVTDALIARANADYKARGGVIVAAPAPTAAPAAGSTPAANPPAGGGSAPATPK